MKKIRIDKRDITFLVTGAAIVLLIGMVQKWLKREKPAEAE
jgi:hypothetical protein